MADERGVTPEILRSLEKRGYTIGRKAGEGAFSQVYCVKRADGLLCAGKISKERLLWGRESAFLQRMCDTGHPLFPRLYESWQEEGNCFLIMEYVSGRGLADWMRDRGRLPLEQALGIGRKLAEGLAFLEEREGLLYRDLKPENIRIDEEGEVKLLDFGCVCLIVGENGRPSIKGADRAGTPGYAAPEQLDLKGDVGAYSDVYAFGRLLHYMLTGDDPYLPPVRKPPIRAYDHSFSFALEELLEDCVRQEGRERPPDMRCVQRRLERLPRQGSLRCAMDKLRGLLGGHAPRYHYEKNILLTDRTRR
ncbi:MAG: serine/threonine protein kinase [Candidatus Gastranaerophilales bacterium]|nr:serine/threonine protein kinase [Candidatus Gastranaerophilales bacterium]